MCQPPWRTVRAKQQSLLTDQDTDTNKRGKSFLQRLGLLRYDLCLRGRGGWSTTRQGGLGGAREAFPGMAGQQQHGLEVEVGSSQGMASQSQNTVELSQATGEKDVKITYSKIGNEGEENKFKCDACEKVCEKEQSIRTHITKMHTKKKEAEKRKVEDDDLADNDKREKRMFEMYGGGTISQAPPLEVLLNGVITNPPITIIGLN